VLRTPGVGFYMFKHYGDMWPIGMGCQERTEELLVHRDL
jgi:hypothetical protein